MKKFEYSFDEENEQRLTIEYSAADAERLHVGIQEGKVMLFGNRAGLLTLAKILVKLALGPYRRGYHLHLNVDFDADKEEVLCVGVDPEESVNR